MIGLSEALIPTFVPPASPRLSSRAMTRTSGKSRARRASESSLEPLSTRIVSKSRQVCPRNDARQVGRRWAPFQLTTTTAISGICATWPPGRRGLYRWSSGEAVVGRVGRGASRAAGEPAARPYSTWSPLARSARGVGEGATPLGRVARHLPQPLDPLLDGRVRREEA